MTTRPLPRTPEALLAVIQRMGVSPAAFAHIAPTRQEKLVADALKQHDEISKNAGKQDRKAQKRRRDAFRTLRGRAEPGHPGCTCIIEGTVPASYTNAFNPQGHGPWCTAYRTAWSREDQLEALYGDKL